MEPLPLSILFIILSILFLFSFLFSFSETAFISVNKIRLRHLASKGVKNAEIVYNITTHNIDKFLTTILVGNNFVNVTISTIATALFIQLLGPEWGVVFATVIVTLVLLVFAEITPKILAAQHSDKAALTIALPIQFLMRLLSPVTKFFMRIPNLIVRAVGGKISKRSFLITEEEIRIMIEVGKEEGVVGEEERKMLHRIFEFGDTLVQDVMVEKKDIVATEINTTSEELLRLLVEEGHSRIPVYEKDIDHIVGIIYISDILQILENRQLIIIHDIISQAYFVPPTKRVHDLLQDFQRKRTQIAIVKDIDNKTLGLVTLGDLIEEIVGEIEEEPFPLTKS